MFQNCLQSAFLISRSLHLGVFTDQILQIISRHQSLLEQETLQTSKKIPKATQTKLLLC